MLKFASLCLDGLVEVVGTRRTLRATAIFLLDDVLVEQPDCAPALCLNREELISPEHLGKAGLETPMIFQKHSFDIFCKAADTGCVRAKLLKSRWLLGDTDALNDIDSSYASAYEVFQHDFEATERYYLRAIRAGFLHAFYILA
eukprot:IDg2299t1